MNNDNKTPEEMAIEYAELMSFDVRGHQRGFLAGYKAAKDQVLARFKSLLSSFAETSFNPNHTAWQIFDTLNENQAAQDQFADADKVMPQWISVHERLPPDGAKVLLIVFGDIHYGWIDQSPSDPTEYCLYFSNTYIDKGHHALTHWMPIPSKPKYMSDYVEYEAPKEEK